MVNSFDLVTKEELYEALVEIKDQAYSPQGDDWIWMDDQTPIGQFVDSYVQRFQDTV